MNEECLNNIKGIGKDKCNQNIDYLEGIRLIQFDDIAFFLILSKLSSSSDNDDSSRCEEWV